VLPCGYCTPGWLTATAALLVTCPHPSEEQIAAALEGHICRCCTYPRIRRAVQRAAELMEQPESLLPVPPPQLPGQVQRPGAALPWDSPAKDEGTFVAGLPGGLVTVAAAGGGPAQRVSCPPPGTPGCTSAPTAP